MNEETYEISVDLKSVLEFINSDIFNNFLKNNTTLSNGLFISEVLTKTINYMIEDVVEQQIKNQEVGEADVADN